MSYSQDRSRSTDKELFLSPEEADQ
jgi:hypothetical protein